MRNNVLLRAIFIILVVAMPLVQASAFQMVPTGDKSASVVVSQETLLQRITDRAGPGIASLMAAPVHERIAHLIYGCNGDRDVCSNPKAGTPSAPAAVIAGVEWNDNPPFLLTGANINECSNAIKNGQVIQLPKQFLCWALLLKDAEKKAGSVSYTIASGSALILRIHYGDLQFVHAMASKDGENPEVTRKNVMMWAEFTWRVATGDFILGTRLVTTVPGMEKLFSSGWSVQQIFTLGDPTYRRQIKDVAFGSLLHLVSDSFALGHTDRAESTGDICIGMPADYYQPGNIRNFHSYGKQDHPKHKRADSQDALDLHLATVGPNILEIGQRLLDLYRTGKKWDDVKPYLECIFTLDANVTASVPGTQFSVKESSPSDMTIPMSTQSQ